MSIGKWRHPTVKSSWLASQSTTSEMHDNVSRTAALFISAGLASGTTTVWIYSRDWLSFPIGGIIFFVGIAGSLIVASSLGWLSTRFSTKNYIVSAAFVCASHPATLWFSSLIETVCNWVCRSASSSSACQFLVRGGWIEFLITAFSTSVVVVASVSIALWILTRRWEKREFVFLVLAVIGTTWSSLVLTTFLQDFGSSIQLNGQDWTYFATLAMVGESLLALISVHWISNGV